MSKTISGTLQNISPLAPSSQVTPLLQYINIALNFDNWIRSIVVMDFQLAKKAVAVIAGRIV